MRGEAARIIIPACVNPQRRERSLADPELFLNTYFGNRYTREFGKLHHKLIESIYEIARYGGKQALAAPRGRGKTEIVKGMIAFLLFAGLIRFPIPIGQTTEHARKIYADFRKKVMTNDLLAEDFPEVCYPVRDLEGAPQRAGKQHVDGVPTGIVWTVDELCLASIPEAYRGPIDYGGVRMVYRGLDAAIRGVNHDGDRPDFVMIDDPETRESAKSEGQIEDRERAIDQDVDGLAGEDYELSMVMLTTIQNRYCLSYRYTDPEQKPSWLGKRFGWVEKWPSEWNLGGEEGVGKWHEYIALRQTDQRDGDRYGRKATEFYLANRQAMDAGAELLADNFKTQTLEDGWQTVHSALQEVFNKIADTSYEAFCTEYQNDPPEKEQIQTLELTPGYILGCVSGVEQGVIPDGTRCCTLGIDIGKYDCWFVKTAWNEQATGSIVEYGTFRTMGLDKHSSPQAVEHAIIEAVVKFSEVMLEKNEPPLLTLVDSGNWSEAVYEACRRAGHNFYPAKGWDNGTNRFTMPKPSADKQPFLESYASRQFDAARRQFWLYNVNTEWWKNWLQERWLVRTFTDSQRTPGSMAVFDPPHGDVRFHSALAKSMVSERLEHIPLPNKGFKKQWIVKDKYNNHLLDSAALSCAAAGCVGIRVVQSVAAVQQTVKPEEKRTTVSPFARGGRAFVASQR